MSGLVCLVAKRLALWLEGGDSGRGSDHRQASLTWPLHQTADTHPLHLGEVV